MILPKLCPLNLQRCLGVLTLGDHAKEVALLLHHQKLVNDVGIEELTQSLCSGTGVFKHEVLLLKLQDIVKAYLVENPKEQTLIKKVSLFSTCNTRIAPKTVQVVKVCHNRDPTYGNNLKESKYFPGLFLVYFYQIERYFYCGVNAVKFEGACNVTYYFSPGSKPTEPVDMIGIQNKSDDLFLILFHILSGKIHNIEGTPGTNLTIPKIVKLFKPFFTWMTADKLYKYISKHCSKLHTKQSAKKSIGTNNSDKKVSTVENTPTKPKATPEFAARKAAKVSPCRCLILTVVVIYIKNNLYSFVTSIRQ